MLQPHSRWRSLTVCSLVLLSCGGSAYLRAQSSNTRSEFWPELDGYVRLSSQFRLYLTYSATREDDLQTYSEGKTGGFLDFYTLPLLGWRLHEHPDEARKRLLMFRGGYYYSRSPNNAGISKTEHIPTFLADARIPLPWSLQLVERNRGDLQFINGVFTPLYRNRLRLERAFKAGRFHLTPFVEAEAFYDWRYDKFNRYRYTAGGDWTVNRHFVFEGAYTRQRDTKSTPEFVNAVVARLKFYFP